MTKLKKGDKVKVHYIGTLKDGSEFDSSRKREQTLEFVIDDGKMLKGFNDVVKDLNVGEKKITNIPANEAYGDYITEAVITVKKAEFPPEMKFDIDGFVQGQIVKVEDDTVNLDMNHPLAGEDLNFEIELVEVVA